MNIDRKQVKNSDKWNVAALYSSYEKWLEDFNKEARVGQTVRWPELAEFRGKLAEGSSIVKQLLDTVFNLERKLFNLYTYLHLRHDEDIADDKHKEGYGRVMSTMHELSQAVSWIEPELLNLPENLIQEYLQSQELREYRFHLEKILRLKKHTLPPEQEELLALSGQALQAASKAFSAINDADFDFGTVLDGEGNERALTHASYGLYLRSHDRILRKNSFTQLHQKYAEYENTLCELLNGQVQNHLFKAKARKYSSCVDAALYPKNIETDVYRALIQAVNESLPALHKYMALREKVLDCGPLHLYDMYVPLISEVDIKFSYDEAVDAVIASATPLGSEYQNLLKQGLKEDGWVDRYENKNKRSGAYSSGSYDSMPYILMNYKGTLRDVFTLAHEAGHSMHSLLSHKNQPYHYADYPIFLAEVASTFNEELLMSYMLEKSQSADEKIYLINEKIEDIRGTLFRQTMFAEFELLIHDMAENHEPLTPAKLKDEYRKLNEKYFGPAVVIDEIAQIEWARIPHFYYNFYVYQYATGISAALALAKRVQNGSLREREDYLNFLKSGCSKYPIDTLKDAGVDMSTPGPVKAAIEKFSQLVDQLDSLIAQKV